MDGPTATYPLAEPASASRAPIAPGEAAHAWAMDPASIVLQVISGLCAQGMPPEKANYFQQKVYPFMSGMATYVMETLPQQPEIAAILWLMDFVRAPMELQLGTREWADRHWRSAGRFSCEVEYRSAESECQSTAPAVFSAVKSAPAQIQTSRMTVGGRQTIGPQSDVIITPSGNIVEKVKLVEQQELSDAERLQIITQSKLLKQLDEATLAEVCRLTVERSFLEGTEAVSLGTQPAGLYLIYKGDAHVKIMQEVGELSAGDIFGHVGLLQNEASSETIEAKSQTLRTLFLPSTAFEELGLRHKLGGGIKKKERAAARRDKTVVNSSSNDDKEEDFELEYATDEVDLNLIKEALENNQNLQEVLSLTPPLRERISRWAYRIEFKEEDVVFRRGMGGHIFYIVRDGAFEVSDIQDNTERRVSYDHQEKCECGNIFMCDSLYCRKCGAKRVSPKLESADSKPSTQEKKFLLHAGSCFGELALLYDAPRSAKVTCKRAGSCWAVTRSTLKSVMQQRTEYRIQDYMHLVDSVEIFKSHNLSEEDQKILCNTLEERSFYQGECIITEGEEADSCYIIADGRCAWYKDNTQQGEISRGAVLGERSLQTRQHYDISVQVMSAQCLCLVIDRLTFDLLLQASVVEDSDSRRPSITKGEELWLKANRKIRHRARFEKFIRNAQRQMAEEQDIIQQSERELIPRHRLEHIGVLGRGAFGSVSLCRDMETQRLYALKAMSKGHIVQERLKEAVTNEKACMSMLHSNFIVGLWGTYRDEACVYLLLEPCFGGELFDFFAQNDHLFSSSVHVRFYAACCAMGLEHMHEPVLHLRAESADLELDVAFHLPIKKHKDATLPLFLIELAQGISKGTVLDRRKALDVKRYETELQRKIQLRRERHEFYTEVRQGFEQLTQMLRQLKHDYYREVDHLRDQLRAKRGKPGFEPDDVTFLNDTNYKLPHWEDIVNLLDERRMLREQVLEHNGGVVKHVPVGVLCKSCKGKFAKSDVPEEAITANTASQTMYMPTEREMRGLPPLITRWVQTDDSSLVQSISMETQTEGILTASVSKLTDSRTALLERTGLRAEEGGIDVGIQACVSLESVGREIQVEPWMLQPEPEPEREDSAGLSRSLLADDHAAIELKIEEAKQRKDEEWGNRLARLRRELEEHVAEVQRLKEKAARQDREWSARLEAVRQEAVDAQQAIEEGWRVKFRDMQSESEKNKLSPNHQGGDGDLTGNKAPRGDHNDSATAKVKRVESEGALLGAGSKTLTTRPFPKSDSVTSMRRAFGAMSLNKAGRGLSISQRKQLAAKMLERRLQAFQRHLARTSIGRVHAPRPTEVAPLDSQATVREQRHLPSTSASSRYVSDCLCDTMSPKSSVVDTSMEFALGHDSRGRHWPKEGALTTPRTHHRVQEKAVDLTLPKLMVDEKQARSQKSLSTHRTFDPANVSERNTPNLGVTYPSLLVTPRPQ